LRRKKSTVEAEEAPITVMTKEPGWKV